MTRKNLIALTQAFVLLLNLSWGLPGFAAAAPVHKSREKHLAEKLQFLRQLATETPSGSEIQKSLVKNFPSAEDQNLLKPYLEALNNGYPKDLVQLDGQNLVVHGPSTLRLDFTSLESGLVLLNDHKINLVPKADLQKIISVTNSLLGKQASHRLLSPLLISEAHAIGLVTVVIATGVVLYLLGRGKQNSAETPDEYAYYGNPLAKLAVSGAKPQDICKFSLQNAFYPLYDAAPELCKAMTFKDTSQAVCFGSLMMMKYSSYSTSGALDECRGIHFKSLANVICAGGLVDRCYASGMSMEAANEMCEGYKLSSQDAVCLSAIATTRYFNDQVDDAAETCKQYHFKSTKEAVCFSDLLTAPHSIYSTAYRDAQEACVSSKASSHGKSKSGSESPQGVRE